MHEDTDLEHKTKEGLTALMIAAKEGHTALVAHLLSAADSTRFWHCFGPFLTDPSPAPSNPARAVRHRLLWNLSWGKLIWAFGVI